MAQDIEQLQERFSQLGKPDSLDRDGVTTYALNTEEYDAALVLTQGGASEEVAEHAFMALISQHQPVWLGHVLKQADESLLKNMQESVTAYALPYYDAPLISELENIIAESALGDSRRLYATHLLEEFSSLHPEYYGRIVKALGAQLQRYANNPVTLNGQLIATCITLQADELMPIIETVYQQQAVNSELYPDLTAAQSAMQEPETAFESGLEMFMHTRELDEIRQQLEVYFDAAAESTDIRNVAALDGFFHALSLSPVPVSRSVWLPFVSSSSSELFDAQYLEEVIDMLTTYFSEVSDAIRANTPGLFIQTADDEINDSSVKEWAIGFLQGYHMLATDPEVVERSRDASAELVSSMQSLATNGCMPVQYETLGQGDVGMIVQLMLLRAFAELQAPEYADSHDELNDFFADFSPDHSPD